MSRTGICCRKLPAGLCVSPAQFKQVKGVAYDQYDETKTAAGNHRVEIYMYAGEEMVQEAETKG